MGGQAGFDALAGGSGLGDELGGEFGVFLCLRLAENRGLILRVFAWRCSGGPDGNELSGGSGGRCLCADVGDWRLCFATSPDRER